MYTIGIDIGTTGTKAVLWSVEAGIVAQTARDATLLSPSPGFAEADTRQWRKNAIECIAELLNKTGVHPKNIRGLSTSGMVPAVVFLDSKMRPLRNAILQNDARASEEIRELSELFSGIELVSLTGSDLSQQSVAPTVLWLQKHEPQTWSKTSFIVGSYDWLLIEMGAIPHIEWNWALESGLFSVEGNRLEQVFGGCKLDSIQIPLVQHSGSIVGNLSHSFAESTGLSPETLLVVGGADHVLSAFAAGVENSGDWLVKLGGAGDILAASDRPILDSRLYLDAHPIPNLWLPNGCMATSGSLLRWFQQITGQTSLSELDARAETCDPASLLCLPYFLGEKSPLHDPDLRGAFAGLHLGHTTADLYRAVLEGIAYGFRHHAEVFEEVGLERGRVLVTNGGSRSTFWKQIHADVLGFELYPVVDHPGASLGAAEIAAIGVGILSGWTEAGRHLRIGDPVLPNTDNAQKYQELYSLWKQLGTVLAPISHRISRRRE